MTFDSENNACPPRLGASRILLASNSPRRRELLALIVPEFEIPAPAEVEEVYPAGLEPERVPVYLSQLKAAAYRDRLRPDDLLITADTVVIADGRILGKPHGAADAVAMLHQLSGRTHTVVTGVTICKAGGYSESFAESTEVTFRKLDDREIEEYVRRYRPFDKAGSYGIQEYIGAIGITGIRGCFYNVMGLPVSRLYERLKSLFGNKC